jgi:hypothetical protein
MHHLPTNRSPEGAIQYLLYRRAITLGPEAGELTIVEGIAWLTRKDDAGDYFLQPGESLRIEAGERAVIESGTLHAFLGFRWQPVAQRTEDALRRALGPALLEQG